MSTLIELESTDYAVVDNSFIEVTPSTTEVCLGDEAPISVEARKVEYAVVGDALFASQNIGEAPQWLTSIIDQVIGSSLDSSLTDLVQAREDMVQALTELNIANNNYAEIINIDVTVDQAVTSRLAVVNSNLAQANATIADLQTTRVTADQASAMSLGVIASSLNSTDSGTIGGSITTLASSVNTLSESVTSTRQLVESRYGEVNGSVDVLAQSVSDLEGNLSNFTVTVNSNFQDINNSLTSLNVQTEATANTVATMFEFNSVLQVGTNYYKSGFGLRSSATTGGSGTLVDPYISEFWIDATKLKFTNSQATGSVSPFTIDATGTTPEIKFTGRVEFSNPGEDLVGTINSGTTTINGGKITTGSITADKIDVTDLVVKKLQANTGPSPTGMVIDTVNGFIKVFDAAGNLRVQLGNLSV